MNMTKQKTINPIFMTVLIVIVAALMLSGCECPYPEKAKAPYNRTINYQGDKLTADLLPGLWQCYYPMYVGNVEFKEIRMFSAIDTHDFETKVNQANKFLKGGDKLKVSVRFRKRAIAHPELGSELLDRFKEACSEYGTVEKPAKMEGRSIVMFISPKASK
jgi:hypothetical protein